MKTVGIAMLFICVVIQTFNYYCADKRAEFWHDRWKTDTDSLLASSKKWEQSDLNNRTSLMRYDCLLKKQIQFAHDVNIVLRSGNWHPLDIPSTDGCMKLEAAPL